MLNNYFKFKYMVWYNFKKISILNFLTQGVAHAMHMQPLLVLF